jgi:hypothetical protein
MQWRFETRCKSINLIAILLGCLYMFKFTLDNSHLKFEIFLLFLSITLPSLGMLHLLRGTVLVPVVGCLFRRQRSETAS